MITLAVVIFMGVSFALGLNVGIELKARKALLVHQKITAEMLFKIYQAFDTPENQQMFLRAANRAVGLEIHQMEMK